MLTSLPDENEEKCYLLSIQVQMGEVKSERIVMPQTEAMLVAGKWKACQNW